MAKQQSTSRIKRRVGNTNDVSVVVHDQLDPLREQLSLCSHCRANKPGATDDCMAKVSLENIDARYGMSVIVTQCGSFRPAGPLPELPEAQILEMLEYDSDEVSDSDTPVNAEPPPEGGMNEINEQVAETLREGSQIEGTPFTEMDAGMKRINLVFLLKKYPEGISTKAVADEFGVSWQSVSRPLGDLVKAGQAEKFEHDGEILFRAVDQSKEELIVATAKDYSESEGE